MLEFNDLRKGKDMTGTVTVPEDIHAIHPDGRQILVARKGVEMSKAELALLIERYFPEGEAPAAPEAEVSPDEKALAPAKKSVKPKANKSAAPAEDKSGDSEDDGGEA